MQLIQLLLPLYSNEGKAFPEQFYTSIRNELTETFGGLTIYVRSPALGLWKEEKDKTVKDDIVIYEVMSTTIDPTYWNTYKIKLQKLFEQDELIIRASAITLI